jgi:hypothetical protein
MFKSRFVSVVFLSIIFARIILAQDSLSVQLSGELISPGSSSKGLTGVVQLNYLINSKISLYFYSGYATWDKFRVYFQENYSTIQKQTISDSYSSDNHIFIPVYAGGKFSIYNFKVFSLYLNVEFGYSYLSYNNYDNKKRVYPETGAVVGYCVDSSTKQKIHENLLEWE